ncbi:hypothetical protein L9F63_027614, partial [Diploptera punctata]
TLTITIIDENDTPPEFTNIDEITIRESTDPNVSIGFVTATDADENNTITYSILCGDPSKEYLAINKETGRILTGPEEIDYEGLPTPADSNDLRDLNCTVFASDTVHVTNEILTIKVMDINDNTPYITGIKGDYSTTIELDERTDDSKEFFT